jgi:hypothetical protein
MHVLYVYVHTIHICTYIASTLSSKHSTVTVYNIYLMDKHMYMYANYKSKYELNKQSYPAIKEGYSHRQKNARSLFFETACIYKNRLQ